VRAGHGVSRDRQHSLDPKAGSVDQQREFFTDRWAILTHTALMKDADERSQLRTVNTGLSRMPTIHSDNKHDLEPLAVTPRQACGLLNIGNTRLYELIAAGELESYHEGRARRITMASIRRRFTQLLAAEGTSKAMAQTVPPRRRGRPPKQPATEARS
jgi:excisionase family DNA binding protein